MCGRGPSADTGRDALLTTPLREAAHHRCCLFCFCFFFFSFRLSASFFFLSFAADAWPFPAGPASC
jgi:hypothetical protein